MALPTAGTGAEQDQFWPMPKFYFSVDIGDMTDLPFQEVSGLEVETEMIEYRHGNSPNHSKIKMPGLLKYADVTLKKGVFADEIVPVEIKTRKGNFIDFNWDIKVFFKTCMILKSFNFSGCTKRTKKAT